MNKNGAGVVGEVNNYHQSHDNSDDMQAQDQTNQAAMRDNEANANRIAR